MAATKSMTRWLAGLLLGLFAATTAALGAAGWAPSGVITCPFRILTTVRCPLCGMTRATLRLLHGDLPGALHLHPAAPLVLLLLGGGLVYLLVALARGRAPRLVAVPLPLALATLGGVWIANLLWGHG